MDIRNFFGGTKKQTQEKETNPTVVTAIKSAEKKVASGHSETSPPSKREINKGEAWLEDSDDEDKNATKQNKRLRTMKQRTDGTENQKTSIISLGAETESNHLASKSPENSIKSPSKNTASSSYKPLQMLESPSQIKRRSMSPPSSTISLAATDSAKKQKLTVEPKDFFGSSEEGASKIIKSPESSKAEDIAGRRQSPRKASNIQTTSAEKSGSQLSSTINDPPTTKQKKFFDDMRIGVSGVFVSMTREGLEEFIQCNGGKIASSISGKTSFLVVGELLEDGRPGTEGSKYKAAIEKDVKVYSEREFFEKYPNIVASSSAPSSDFVAPPTKKAPSQTKSQDSTSNDLWVDKYKPKHPNELIGHGDIVKKLSDWLRSWHAVHVNKTMKITFNKENPGAKAVLLSGPPGIGKSSVAGIIARQMGYEILELNASDTRNKSEIDNQLVEAVSTQALSLHGMNRSNTTQLQLQRRLVIMDEVDGMGGSDRGGIAELIKVIKVSKIPIICICNDRQAQKIRSLVNHCYDLRVRRPTKGQIATRLVSIAHTEGLEVDNNAAEMLIEQSGNDIRQALNALQMWSCGNDTLNFMDMKTGLSRIEKDKVLRQTPFDACLNLLGGNKLPFEERYNSFFIDYSLVPLLIQQNYIDASKNGVCRNPALDDAGKLEALSRAADSVSDVDMIGSMIRGADQHWELLPAQAALCMRVGEPIYGFQAFPSFPQWLGKYSATGKRARLTREIVQHTSLSIGQGFIPIRLDYIPFLRKKLMQPLLRQGKDGVAETVAMLDDYGLSKDDLMESMREMQFLLEKDVAFKDLFEGIDTATKTALTKHYNATSHTSATLPQSLPGIKNKKKKVASSVDDGDEMLDDDEDALEGAEEEEEGEEEEDLEALRAQLSKSVTKGKSKAPANSSSRGKGAAKANNSKKK